MKLQLLGLCFLSGWFAFSGAAEDVEEQMGVATEAAEGSESHVVSKTLQAKPHALESGQASKPEESSQKDLQDLQELCRAYDQKYIAYYSDVFLVKDCQRHRLSSADLESVLKKREHVQDVEGSVISLLPLSQTTESLVSAVRSCETFDKRYVTAHFVYVYYIENCVKRQYPDWDTWSDDQKKRPDVSAVIMQLSDAELAQMEDGPSFSSVFDNVQKLTTDEEPDLIPLDEACLGLNGQWTSYYQHIYRIEGCQKRLASARYLLGNRLVSRPVELTDQQWMSLPDGDPLLSSQESLERDEP